jgi:hypothetical protein
MMGPGTACRLHVHIEKVCPVVVYSLKFVIESLDWLCCFDGVTCNMNVACLKHIIMVSYDMLQLTVDGAHGRHGALVQSPVADRAVANSDTELAVSLVQQRMVPFAPEIH